jgi:8-oxo-dGTP diphosphatase
MKFNQLPRKIILKIAKYLENEALINLFKANEKLMKILITEITERIQHDTREIKELEEKSREYEGILALFSEKDTKRWENKRRESSKILRTIEENNDHQPRFVLNIMFNKEGIYLSQRTCPEKVMHKLWQVPGGKVENKETSLEAILRETHEETGVQLKRDQPILIFNDPEYDCDVYFTYFTNQILQWTEPKNQGPWIIVSIKDYIRLASSKKTTPTHSTYLLQIIEWIHASLKRNSQN